MTEPPSPPHERTFIKQILHLSTTLESETQCDKGLSGVRTSEGGHGGRAIAMRFYFLSLGHLFYAPRFSTQWLPAVNFLSCLHPLRGFLGVQHVGQGQ